MLVNNPKILDNSLPQFQLRTYLSDLLTSQKYIEVSEKIGQLKMHAPDRLRHCNSLYQGLCLKSVRYNIHEGGLQS